MNTLARIATVCQAGQFFSTIEQNRQYVLHLLELSIRQGPDLVCLPEAFPTTSITYQNIDEVAEDIPGPTTQVVAERALKNHCYIICPLVTRRNGVCWNSVVVFDRNGDILGIYDKIHPVTSSSDYTVFEYGTQPGNEVPIFDLDFGRIGIQICFDILFPQIWARLAQLGARLILWPSAYTGGYPLQAYASLHQFYVVSAVQSGKSRIIDPCGTILAETDQQVNMIVQDINLDFIVCHYDFNYSIPDLILAAYPGQVQIRSHEEAGHFLIEPLSKAVSVAQLKDQFGFISLQEYAQLHENAYQYIHRGVKPPSQQIAHGDRPMYQKW